jgi:glycosyltransferase involved in cell wall biosynthesis
VIPDKRSPAVIEPQIESVVAWDRVAGQIVATLSPCRILCAGAAGGPLADALRDRGVESFEMKRLKDCPSFACNFDLVTCIDAPDRSPLSDALQALAEILPLTDKILLSEPRVFKSPAFASVPTLTACQELFEARGFAPDRNFDASFVAPEAILLRRASAWQIETTDADRACVPQIRTPSRTAETLAKFPRRQREPDHLIGVLRSMRAEIDQLETEIASITESPGWIAVSCYRQWHRNKISNRRWLHQPYELLAGYLLRTFKLLPGLRSLSTSFRTARTGCARRVRADVLDEERPSFKFALLISGCPGDSQRYRTRHQAEQLELLGLSADSAWFDEVDYESAASRYELFIVHRVAYSSELEAFILRARSQGKPVIFDTDDLIFNSDLAKHIKAIKNYKPHETERYLERMRGHYQTMSLCSAVLVSTEHLRNFVLELFPEMPVHINRNAVSDMMTQQACEALETSPAIQDGRVRIAYFSGTKTHEDDFDECAPALAWLLRRHPEARLMLVGHLDVPECLLCFSSRIEIQPLVPWEELPSLLSQTSINLAPLEMNNPFTASKSELKYFEAGLLGIPTVASNVPAFQGAIRHGENGFLCSSTTEWIEALDLLITDSELRERVGNNARHDVLRSYTTRARAPELRHTLAGILSSTRSRSRRFSIGFVIREAAADAYSPVFDLADYLAAQGHDVHLCVDSEVPDCDLAIATDFLTAHVVAALPNAKAKVYLMEDYEPDFFSEDDPRRIEASLAHDFPLKKIAIGERLASHVGQRDRVPVPYIESPVNGRVYRNLNLRREENPIRILFQVPRLQHALAVGVEALYRVAQDCFGAEIAFYGMPVSEDFGFLYESLGELAPDQAAQAMNGSHIHLSFLRTAASSSSREAMACGCALVDVSVADTQLSKDDWRLLSKCKPKAVADAIKRLVNEPELRRSLSSEAERHAARFTAAPDSAHRDFERLLLSHLFMEPTSGRDTCSPHPSCQSQLDLASDGPA